MPGRGRGRGAKKDDAHSVKSVWNVGRPGDKRQATMEERSKARMEQARIQHTIASKKALENLSSSQAYESSSDEDDLDGDRILEELLKGYKGAGSLNDSGKDIISTATTQYLSESFQSGAITCLVCISSVKRLEAIWNCEGCFSTFHLSCIQRWIREGVARKGVLSDENFPNKETPWHCPKCRYEYEQKQCPSKYLCYCGKMLDPPFDPWLVPHSCGSKCEKLLRPVCGHKCLLLCHPGPCPPCPKMVMVTCYCGKMPKTARRCGSSTWSCGSICNKLLACGKHKCSMNCHEGECPACIHTSIQYCVCGKHKQSVPCASPKWHCLEKCWKKYSCSIHHCEKICHVSDCGECPRSGWRTCPCGKTGTDDLPCSEDVRTCNDTCGKSLGCYGQHKCMRRCHYGPCGPCSVIMEKECRCGKRKKEMPCSKDFTCEVKCQKFRDCGNHQCKRKCCNGQCPRCEQVCGRTLQCKNHKCQSPCHQGRCYPCNLTSKVSCNCGKTSITVVCGKEKLTKPPRCRKLCTARSSCHHPVRQTHNCHFGPCKTCTQICAVTLRCGHTCPEKCHDEVLVKTEVKAAGPWELPYKSETSIKCLPCPPCRYPVSKQCLGNHEIADFPCFEAKRYCCGRPCGRSLHCGNHNCALPCHAVEGATDDTMAGTNCAECEEPCSKPRPIDCSHACPLPCHTGPCEPCKKRVRKRCHCGIVILHHICNEWTSASDAEKSNMESCGNNCPKVLSCGHSCTSLCHVGSCPGPESCEKKMTIKCSCKRIKKEFLCPQVQNGANVECDSVCKENKRKADAEKEENLRRKHEEEEKAQQKEIEKFDRMMQKKSKSRRKRQTNEDEIDDKVSFFHTKYFRFGMVALVVAILFTFAYNLVSM